MLSSDKFYVTYFGHESFHLRHVYEALRNNKPNSKFIFLMGDSSLDNKYWFRDKQRAVNGYEDILDPPVSKRDIAFWMNVELVNRGLGSQYTVINCAVETSRLESRRGGSLLEQDEFVKSVISDGDIVVVSAGGNDIALKPMPCTVLNMACLVSCTTSSCIEYSAGPCFPGVSACPCDDIAYGSSTGCCSNLLAFPCGVGYFYHLFQTRLQNYVRRAIPAGVTPAKVLVCSIYYPEEYYEGMKGSWADTALTFLGYNKNPKQLQAIIRSVYTNAISNISIPLTEVVPVPLYEVMNGTVKGDYVARVEPSSSGGCKVAKLLVDKIIGNCDISLEVSASISR